MLLVVGKVFVNHPKIESRVVEDDGQIAVGENDGKLRRNRRKTNRRSGADVCQTWLVLTFLPVARRYAVGSHMP